MATQFLGNLIRYIVSEVQDANGVIFRTRLVKLLYLCDVEYYRSRRQRITELNWKRYLFGPYAFELPEITKRMGLELGEEEFDFSTGRGIKYEVYDSPNPDNWLEPAKRLIVDLVLKRWGNEDLNLLLDYVYCYTEPMKNAQFLEQLDFRKLRTGLRRTESDSIDIQEKDKAVLKQLIEKEGLISRKPLSINRAAPRSDKPNDEPPSPPISGRIKFSDTETIPSITGME